MGIAKINRLGEFARGEQILGQIQHGDVAMMGIFGEQIQHAFVLSPFFHEIVQDQHTPTRRAKPFGQMTGVR